VFLGRVISGYAQGVTFDTCKVHVYGGGGGGDMHILGVRFVPLKAHSTYHASRTHIPPLVRVPSYRGLFCMYIGFMFKWVRVGGTIDAPTTRVQMMGLHILGFWGFPALTFSRVHEFKGMATGVESATTF
jgi:hypothetical protein